MARELRWWLAAAFIACGLIAGAYVPPRGVAPPRKRHARSPEPTAARRRAQALADQWRWADRAVRLEQYRRQLAPELARRRETDQPGPAFLVDAPDTFPASARARLRSALDTVWRELGLGVSKVGVGVVIDVWRTGMTPVGEAPRTTRDDGYLLPDSTDRATCVALITAWYWTRTLDEAKDRLRAGLGECAFYGAYGVPGGPVRSWLARRNYDLARFPSWSSDVPHGREWTSVFFAEREQWLWQNVYAHPVATVGCLAGRTASCRTAVLAGSLGTAGDSLGYLVTSDLPWLRNERLVHGQHYLGDVAREVGHDRFLRFWSSTEPVDTALAAALETPIGEWTDRWQHRSVPRLRLGPTAPLSATVLGLLLGGLAVAAVAATAARRDVG
jgi:hypothetical protein